MPGGVVEWIQSTPAASYFIGVILGKLMQRPGSAVSTCKRLQHSYSAHMFARYSRSQARVFVAPPREDLPNL